MAGGHLTRYAGFGLVLAWGLHRLPLLFCRLSAMAVRRTTPEACRMAEPGEAPRDLAES